MPTRTQLIFGARKPKRERARFRVKEPPQRRGTVVSVYVAAPRKPNSAMRKMVRIRLPGGKVIAALVPGEGHSVQEHADIFCYFSRVQDVPGVRHRVLRGRGDVASVEKRRRGRSHYGTKKPKES